MTIATRPPLDADAFLRWAEGREGRYEFSGGRIEMMVGASRNHAAVAFDLAMALASRIDRGLWRVTSAELGVQIGETIRCPDVLVEPSGADGRENVTAAPVLIAEVLSPSSVALDLTTKTREYTSLASLRVYLVASQDEPRIWVWRRGADGTFPLDPDAIEGRDAMLALPEFGIDVPLAEIYRGIGS